MLTTFKLIFKKLKGYFWNNLVSTDQLFNTILFGDPDETLSSRMGKSISENKCILCKFICGILNIFDSQHCKKSIESDEGANNILN